MMLIITVLSKGLPPDLKLRRDPVMKVAGFYILVWKKLEQKKLANRFFRLKIIWT